MYFNISFDLISLLVLIVLTVRFCSLRKFPIFSNFMYGFLLVLGLFNILLDILGTAAINHVGSISLGLAYLPNVLYYVSQLAISAALVLYLIALLENQKTVNQICYLLALIPFAICGTVFAIGMPLGQVFRILPDGGYEYGPLSWITYITVAIYLFLMLSILKAKKEFLSRKIRFSMLTLSFLVVLSATLQKIFPEQLLSGSAIALSFLIMYFSIQDPQMMLDPDTGIFNARAFTVFLDNDKTLRKDIYIAAFKLHGLHNIYMLKGHEVGDGTLSYIGQILQNYKRSWSFRAGDAVFATCFRTESELKKFEADFEVLRSSSLNIAHTEFNPSFTMIMIKRCEGFRNSKDILAVINMAFDKKNIANIKNSSTFLTTEKIEQFRKNVQIENEIRLSLKQKTNFTMHYQPIYSLKNNCFVSAEALVRYESETLGKLSPGLFVPMIETKGLVQDLDSIVIDLVFSDIQKGIFNELGFNSVHINLSASTFSSEKTIQNILKVAKERNIDSSKVIFEVTETAISLSESSLKNCVAMLCNAGFGIALDDFGVGYANIGRLYSYPFNVIKLDRCVINESSIVFKEIAGVFKAFALDIVAEGVETEDQVELIKDSNVDLIQGFYYSKPMPVEQLIPFVQNYGKDKRQTENKD